MARTKSPSDFQVTIDEIGTFSFAKRTLRIEMEIAAEVSRLTEGVLTPTPWLSLVSGWIATLKVLTVEAPSGWDVDSMDPLDEATYSKLAQVHKALREKEGSFRQIPGKAGEESGQDSGKES